MVADACLYFKLFEELRWQSEGKRKSVHKTPLDGIATTEPQAFPAFAVQLGVSGRDVYARCFILVSAFCA